MNAEVARLLVAELVAAFPYPTPPASTIALYEGELTRLKNEDAARAAVAAVVRGARRFPPLAEVLEAYRREVRARAPTEADWRALAEEAREPIPQETVDWLAARGIDVAGLLRFVEPKERRERAA
jgi:hypothetical protein